MPHANHGPEFHSLYRHGFIRTAVAIPHGRLSDPRHNGERILALAEQAASVGAGVVLFPELGLSAYCNDDLFHQQTLLNACRQSLNELISSSHQLLPLLVVGLPLAFHGRLYNCAAVIYRGRLLGLVPKSYLPNYREFYEKRQFAAAREATFTEVIWQGERVPFGAGLLFETESFCLGVEICEDVWTPIPPSSRLALGGATLILNPSASNITLGKADYRQTLCAAQSGRCMAGYLYSAAGSGESTTDLAWDGYALIYENGELLAESERFCATEQLIIGDIDIQRLQQERMRSTSFGDSLLDHRAAVAALRRVAFEFEPPPGPLALARQIDRFPFVPNAPERRDERCFEAYNIQVHGLVQRLRASGIEKLVIGVSGGLDSTQALIVAAKAMDQMGLPRSHILAYTLPGFATSSSTYHNAWALMRALKVSAEEIDIKPASHQMLKDLRHPAGAGQPHYDITYENVQAGARTALLFRLANHHNAMVLGTGDLSELALGWTTYGVGDHMSHYGVNASVPKTLIQHLIRWVIASEQFDAATHRVLGDILTTEISPELVPGEAGADTPSQRTEDIIGPYELQDFNLYYLTRFGFVPSKVAFLAHAAWSDRECGAWPEGIEGAARHQYDLATIKSWLELFIHRFFQTSQFKRSCLPNGPKVSSGGSLSPRGDWRAPSDGNADVWLAELRHNVPDA